MQRGRGKGVEAIAGRDGTAADYRTYSGADRGGGHRRHRDWRGRGPAHAHAVPGRTFRSWIHRECAGIRPVQRACHPSCDFRDGRCRHRGRDLVAAAHAYHNSAIRQESRRWCADAGLADHRTCAAADFYRRYRHVDRPRGGSARAWRDVRPTIRPLGASRRERHAYAGGHYRRGRSRGRLQRAACGHVLRGGDPARRRDARNGLTRVRLLGARLMGGEPGQGHAHVLFDWRGGRPVYPRLHGVRTGCRTDAWRRRRAVPPRLPVGGEKQAIRSGHCG